MSIAFKMMLIVVRVTEGTPASLVFSEGMFYSCSSSSSRYEQSAYARKRTLLLEGGGVGQVFAARKSRLSWINMFVNTFDERAHIVRRDAKAARGAIS